MEIVNKGRRIELNLDEGSDRVKVLKPPTIESGASWQDVIADRIVHATGGDKCQFVFIEQD